MLKKHGATYLFILIILIAAFLRFYRLPEMAIFDYDQEWAVNFAYQITHEYPIQLIGQSLSIRELFMGPIGFYLLTPFYLLSSLHPLGGSAGAAFFGLAIIASYFFVGKELVGTKAGLIAAFIRAISFSEVASDLNPAPLTISELLVLYLWFAFYKYWHGNKKALPFIALILGLFTSMHPVHLPFYLVFLALLLKKRLLPDLKTALFAVIGFVTAIFPLLLFEIFHQFLEVKRFISLFTQQGSQFEEPGRLAHWVNFNLQEIPRLLAINSPRHDLIAAAAVMIAIILVVKKTGFWKDRFHSVMLALTVVAFLAYYGIALPKGVSEYYFLALKTLTILYLGASLTLLLKKTIAIPILIILLVNIGFVNFRLFQTKWENPGLITLSHKDYIVKEILKRQAKDQEFFVSYISLPGWTTGFDYFFKLYGQIPQTREAKDPIYTIVIPKELSPGAIDVSSGNIGLILPD